MSMHSSNARYSTDPVDLGAQSDLIGAPVSKAEAVLAAHSGGSARGYQSASCTLTNLTTTKRIDS